MDEAVAVAVVRAWIPMESPHRLLVRVTAVHAGQAGSDEVKIGVAASVDEAIGLLRAWLDAFARAHVDDGQHQDDRPDSD